ncbi:hypothetical protein [Caenibius sp. WL]|uniref:hypothetical protein n=1 Tax=Caenibius sp. WL TaxID=2872646 RepID=UPI001C9A0BD1|nr:hypothetical protein [Caenibius sp. WL]QZP08722.1 hypothetical protein K5X80_02700 [Caenibius sp. WL]
MNGILKRFTAAFPSARFATDVVASAVSHADRVNAADILLIRKASLISINKGDRGDLTGCVSARRY